MSPSLKSTIAALPLKPGVYLFSDAAGEIIYVGKSRELKKRVASYFQKTAQLTAAKQELVREIVSLQSIVAPSEHEALLLEATLIKRHQPRYNVILKDDKSYLYVRVNLDEPYPSVEFIRRPKRQKKKRLFGPYTWAGSIRTTMRLLKRLFPYRTCDQGPSEPCFDSRLGRCLGHDLAPDSRERYAEIVRNVIDFLEGRTQPVLETARRLMAEAATQRHFELAAKLRDQLGALERLTMKQVVIGHGHENLDVVGVARHNSNAAVSVLLIREGRIIDQRLFLLSARVDEGISTVLSDFLELYYADSEDRPKQLVVRTPLTDEFTVLPTAQIHLAHRGRHRQLVEMADTNAQEFLERKLREAMNSKERGRRAMEDLLERLHLPARPERIETYDISNIQGTNSVGSCVVFEHGMPAKDWYRKFKIKSVEGSDDFKSMAEVLTRRLRNKEWPLPDLFVIDGGKGQLSAVQAVLDEQGVKTPAIGLAKREEEIFRPGQRDSIRLPADSEALLLLERMRDEAHRFAIGFYRGRHRDASTQSVLDTIEGIGPKTKKLLLTTFGSVSGIREATDTDLDKLIGKKLRDKLREQL